MGHACLLFTWRGLTGAGAHGLGTLGVALELRKRHKTWLTPAIFLLYFGPFAFPPPGAAFALGRQKVKMAREASVIAGWILHPRQPEASKDHNVGS